ncbi:isochorismatase family protein [Brevibacillus centrosporus]|uniref:Ureidoacrylate peracid hydrolase n=1 Tax=Brevibacillus centrosporus TaxID=54910 RepID=A0A1I3XEV4_9BACL|nr:isochorismatase family cysteine hydrolase [Brevibacillus centrosporus]MEC2133201.1 cysteine hydrolase [Brevibacillus centrosporus]MED4910955.1 cysteine hydrolase [Brevibacillus centrosporus]RNB64945.1 cysteine hydrolase [Brevibacillus centrosporus]SFK17596.1 ureidoacrylate peracid hydrolase [Brevibacillus centrosporus]GED31194.1 isochorismatase [Brevibacillus centrosporus]
MKTASVPWIFSKKSAVLIVVDMQNDFVREGAVMEVPMAREFLPQMKRLVETCRKHEIPVLFTSHVLYDHYDVSPLETAYNPVLQQKGMRASTDGIQIVSELEPQPDEHVIHKHRYDAFYNTQLETLLRNVRGPHVVDTVIIIGTVTNICCESTARSAFMRDFKVVFVSDANGGLDSESHQATLNIISKVFGRVMATEELIEEIVEKNDR